MRDIRGNYIICWVTPEGEQRDFHRLESVTIEKLKRDALRLYRQCSLYNRYDKLEVWQADDACYKRVCNRPAMVVNLAELDLLYN